MITEEFTGNVADDNDDDDNDNDNENNSEINDVVARSTGEQEKLENVVYWLTYIIYRVNSIDPPFLKKKY